MSSIVAVSTELHRYADLLFREVFYIVLLEWLWHFFEYLECGESKMTEEVPAEGTGDGFVGLIDAFEEAFGGLVIL